MATRIRIPKSRFTAGGLGSPAAKAAVASFIIVCTALFGVFAFYYIRFQKLVDRRMHGPIFANTAKIYAAPKVVTVGEKMDVRSIAGDLRRAGYAEEGGQSKLGTYTVDGTSIRIEPGAESYHNAEPAIVHTSSGHVDRISSADAATEMDSYELEPELVTGLFDQKERSKRRLITYDEIPKTLVDAILSVEDRRFFQHGGVNYVRMVEAALVDLRSGRVKQGGSTLTMQIARGFFLNRDKTAKRKIAEMMIAIELEQRFSKQQILELYVNQVDMGQRGSFAIKGFGEAAQAYFGKDLKDLNLPEAALLAGLVNGPTEFSPYRHPNRAIERRNLVLQAMVENNTISQEQADIAKAVALKVAPPNAEASDAPYYVDLVHDELESRYSNDDLNQQGYRIYTSLDPDLQKAAAEAVEAGSKNIDAQILARFARRSKGKGSQATPPVLPQIALVALDPHTGRVVALVGGRNYGFSQLDHAIAKRPTGSIFKPFVYAAAIDSDLNGQQPPFTPVSLIDDTPGTFAYDDKIYTPKNYEDKYHGQVTARYALAESLNNATVKLAELTGYDRVARLAQQAGIGSVKPTPAMALGAYDATPLEMAGAYTIFANDGVRTTPILVNSVRNSSGDVIENFKIQTAPVLDPRVAYVVTNMMEGVLNFGTGFAVRQSGFDAPAAGKTGTSHDAWFAGYTSNLLCLVWVGNDDYSDLQLSGGTTAAPIWAAFMKRVVQLPQYADVKPFTPPPGVVTVQLDKTTNLLSDAACPDSFAAAFLVGTEPTETCDHASQDQRNFFQRLFGLGDKPKPSPATPNTATASPPLSTPPEAAQSTAIQDDEARKKKGFFGRILGVFKGGDTEDRPTADGQSQPPH